MKMVITIPENEIIELVVKHITKQYQIDRRDHLISVVKASPPSDWTINISQDETTKTNPFETPEEE